MVLVNNTVLSPIPSLICLILFSAISLILCIIYHRERNSLSTITTSFDEISGDEVNDDDDVESQSVLEPAEAIQKTYSDDQQDLNSDLSSSIISSFSVFDLEKSQIQWLRMFLIFNMIIMSLPLLLLYYFRDNSNKESSSLLIDLGLSLGTWLWMAVVIASLPLIWRGTSHGGEATVTAQLKLTHLISACVACSGILALKGVIQFYLQRESIGAANMVTILTTLNFLLPLLQTVCGVVIIQKTGTMIKILEEMAGLNNHDHHSASCNKLSFEKQSDIISFITFSWFNEMIRIGNSKTITLEDVWDLDRDDKTGSVFINYKRVNAGKNNSSCWISTLKGWMGNSSSSSKSNMPSSKKSMVPKLYYLSRSLIIFQIVCALSSSVFAFAGPYCLNKIVGLLATHRKGAELEAAVYVAGLFLCTIARSMCDGQNYFTGRRIGLRVRAIIINEIAAKSLRRAGFVGGGSSCGDGTDGQGDESKGQGTTTNHDNETTPLLKRRQKIHAQNDNDEIDGYFTSNPSSSSLESNVTNLMSVDAHKILEWSCYISYLISTPFQIILCIAMLLFVLGWPAVAGIVLMILMIPVGGALGKLVSVRQKKLMKASDVRISATNEVLSSIRIVKFFNWELSFLNKVTLLRNKELLSLKSYMISVAASRLAWWMCPILVSYSTFMVYTKVAGRDLDATTAFTALALFNTLRNPLQIFPDTIVKMVEALVSFGRIDDFLNETELEQEGDGGEEEEEVCGVGSGGVLRSAVSEEEEVSNPRLVSSFAAAKFINATFSWSDVLPDDDEDNNIHNDDYIPPLENRTSLASSGKSFRLQDLDFEFPRGKLSVVCGVTGSGKSSLLMALLGEMHRVKGHLQMMKSGQIAYASQQAWLQNATIRENICFGKQFNEQWYMTVIAACALTKDFKYLPAGDETEVGEKGLNLSGGQKQRISLGMYKREVGKKTIDVI